MATGFDEQQLPVEVACPSCAVSYSVEYDVRETSPGAWIGALRELLGPASVLFNPVPDAVPREHAMRLSCRRN